MTDSNPASANPDSVAELDVLVVGAGFAGLYLLHRLRGMGFSVHVIEAASGVGGTWYWNRYPGARCDVESMQYSYAFSSELDEAWEWSERYTAQPDILRYANHIADRFDLRRDIRFDTRVEAASFDEPRGKWVIETDDGARLTARFCVMATGCLSAVNRPRIEGQDSFTGNCYHTGEWPHQAIDFTGQRVGIIGTGSSAIQSIPVIAEQAARLYVFQRTAHWTVPAHNHPLDPQQRRVVKADYAGLRARAQQSFALIDVPVNLSSATEATAEERGERYQAGWDIGGFAFITTFGDLLHNRQANATATDFAGAKIQELVDDPQIAALLTPKMIIGGKRLCLDTDYYKTFNRPNVTLVDISDAPIEAINPNGLRAEGRDYELDAIVYATGFDAMTGALLRIDIRGRDELSLRDKWAEGPSNCLGLMMAGFPNLFAITGPGSPSVFTNMLPAIEQHVDWVVDCLDHLRKHGHAIIEPTPEAEADWNAHSNQVAAGHLRSTVDSWYVGANIPGKTRVLMPYIGGYPLYVEKCEEVAAAGYSGFRLSAG